MDLICSGIAVTEDNLRSSGSLFLQSLILAYSKLEGFESVVIVLLENDVHPVLKTTLSQKIKICDLRYLLLGKSDIFEEILSFIADNTTNSGKTLVAIDSLHLLEFSLAENSKVNSKNGRICRFLHKISTSGAVLVSTHEEMFQCQKDKEELACVASAWYKLTLENSEKSTCIIPTVCCTSKVKKKSGKTVRKTQNLEIDPSDLSLKIIKCQKLSKKSADIIRSSAESNSKIVSFTGLAPTNTTATANSSISENTVKSGGGKPDSSAMMIKVPFNMGLTDVERRAKGI